MKTIIYMQTFGYKEIQESKLSSTSFPIADFIYLVFENDILIKSVNLYNVNVNVIKDMFPNVEIVKLKK